VCEGDGGLPRVDITSPRARGHVRSRGPRDFLAPSGQ
jgi:hypothetical protein